MAQQDVVARSAEELSVSEKVISAVASSTGTDPMDLEPLYEVIEPDALEALHSQSGSGRSVSSVRIEFTYGGCDVVIEPDGSVAVTKEAPVGS